MPGTERDRLHGLDDPSVEALLAGRVPEGREDLRALAASLDAMRSVAHGCAPAPSLELAQLFAEPPVAEVGKWTAHRVETTTPRRRRALARMPRALAALAASLLVKFSALGIGAKAALAVTAAGAVAGGATASDLPAVVSDAFGGDHDAEEGEADAPEAAEFGRGVADDASDPADPGVDGPSIADDARQRAEERRPADTGPSEESEESEESDGHPSEDAAADGLEKAREASDGTPARVPEEVPAAGESPATSSDKPANSPDELPGPLDELPGPPAQTPGLPDGPPGPPAQTPGLPDGPPGPPAGEEPGGPPAD